MGKYDTYKLYRGETENPFSSLTPSFKKACTAYRRNTNTNTPDKDCLNNASHLWEYEKIFEDNWKTYDTSDWYSELRGRKRRFMGLIDEADYEHIQEDKKKPLFDLWLDTKLKDKMTDYGHYDDSLALFYKLFPTL